MRGIRLHSGFKLLPALLLLLVTGVLAEQQTSGQNHLAGETSPYLLAHADNPVDWYPWGDQAFEKARTEEKPVFLSIGFATCHWCHLMARESFSDPVVAAFLNENFVSIKVDREERPDVDQLYMGFLQASTGKFGWPLTAFLTPEGKPFFAGGYWERDGLLRQLKKIDREWRRDRDGVLNAAGKVANLLKVLYSDQTSAEGTVSDTALTDAYQWYYSAFDARSGGFGGAPKFPMPDAYGLLLRYHLISGKQGPLSMVVATLSRMAEGAIYDRVAGGFHRYCDDKDWRYPHFEKMLFIQAQLAVNYVEAFQLTGEERFEKVARKTLDYLLTEMEGPRGGFYSSQDAAGPCQKDPERSCLGANFTWSETELRHLLGEDFPAFSLFFGIDPKGNLTGTGLIDFKGLNALAVSNDVASVARDLAMEPGRVEEALARSLETLKEARGQRPRPPLDDKILAGWNGLAITAFSRACQAFGEKRYLEAARRTASLVLERMVDRETGTLRRIYRGEESSGHGYVDDYAMVVQGLLDLYETDLDPRWMLPAIDLNRKQLELFWDSQEGGFFNSAAANRVTGARMKELYDGVDPSPNGISALNLSRLAVLLKDEQLQEKAQKLSGAFAVRLAKSPKAMPQLRSAVAFQMAKPLQIIIAGERDDPATHTLIREIHERFLPFKVLLLADGGDLQGLIEPRLEVLSSMRQIGGKATAYVCQDYLCRYPTNDPGQMVQILEDALRKSDRP